MKYKTKDFKKNNHFVLYDQNDMIICYFDDFKELSKHINYTARKLAYEFNFRNTNIINIIIDDKKLRLATFC